MKRINYILIIAGMLISFGMVIYAAQPWGGNYAYKQGYGYLLLFVGVLWVALPFFLLYLLNRNYPNSKPHLILIFVACLICSAFAAYIYIASIVFSTSSTSALIFIFLPLYQMFFLSIMGLLCWIITKLLNKKSF